MARVAWSGPKSGSPTTTRYAGSRNGSPSASGRRLDDACPFVDAALPDGTRLHAILPPLVAHPTLSLRVLARRRFDLADLVAAGSVEPAVGELLQAIVAARLAFVISGGTGTGKTTLLGRLAVVLFPD